MCIKYMITYLLIYLDMQNKLYSYVFLFLLLLFLALILNFMAFLHDHNKLENIPIRIKRSSKMHGSQLFPALFKKQALRHTCNIFISYKNYLLSPCFQKNQRLFPCFLSQVFYVKYRNPKISLLFLLKISRNSKFSLV